jgi:hypothetical protein
MASRGHAMSVLHQKPFWLQVQQGKVTLMGAETRAPAAAEEFGRSQGNFGEEEQSAHVTVYDEYATEVEISIRRWGAKEDNWSVPEEDQILTWQFQPTGLCEPLAIRFAHKKNWVILHMHPLTARAVDEESNIE